jgi:deoxyribodipyrimidine photolyase
MNSNITVSNSTETVQCAQNIAVLLTPVIGNGAIAVISGVVSFLINLWHHKVLKKEFHGVKERLDTHSVEMQSIRGHSPHEPIDIPTPSEAHYNQPFPFRNAVSYQ